MSRSWSLLLLLPLLACSEAPAPKAAAPTPVAAAPKPAPPPAKPKSDAEKTVLDVALGSPDHKTLVAAVQATDLGPALGSPGGIYTVFAPTDAAFAALPAGTLDELLKPEKKSQLKAIVQHHATVPIVDANGLTDGMVLKMSDGTAVTVTLKDGKPTVDGANILGSVHAVNGVVHVVDKVLLPPG